MPGGEWAINDKRGQAYPLMTRMAVIPAAPHYLRIGVPDSAGAFHCTPGGAPDGLIVWRRNRPASTPVGLAW